MLILSQAIPQDHGPFRHVPKHRAEFCSKYHAEVSISQNTLSFLADKILHFKVDAVIKKSPVALE